MYWNQPRGCVPAAGDLAKGKGKVMRPGKGQFCVVCWFGQICLYVAGPFLVLPFKKKYPLLLNWHLAWTVLYWVCLSSVGEVDEGRSWLSSSSEGSSRTFTCLHQTPVGLPLMLCQNANPRDPPCLPLHTIPEGILRLKMIPLDLQILLLLKWDLKVSTHLAGLWVFGCWWFIPRDQRACHSPGSKESQKAVNIII